MTDPRIDVIFEHLNLVCKFYKPDSIGYWCNRAYHKSGKGCRFTHCEGQLKNCELTEDDKINYEKF